GSADEIEWCQHRFGQLPAEVLQARREHVDRKRLQGGRLVKPQRGPGGRVRGGLAVPRGRTAWPAAGLPVLRRTVLVLSLIVIDPCPVTLLRKRFRRGLHVPVVVEQGIDFDLGVALAWLEWGSTGREDVEDVLPLVANRRRRSAVLPGPGQVGFAIAPGRI